MTIGPREREREVWPGEKERIGELGRERERWGISRRAQVCRGRRDEE